MCVILSSSQDITLALYYSHAYNMDENGDRYALWDFITERGRSILAEWVKDDRLSSRDKAILNGRIDKLAKIDFDQAIGTKLLNGPIYKHVYKMKLKGDVMLRPMLCRGPVDIEAEYTFLLGAVEIGGKLPKGSKEKAEQNRGTILDDHSRRREHEKL